MLTCEERRDIPTEVSQGYPKKTGAVNHSGVNVHELIAELSRRVRENGDFPHEVGFFLGYPPSDVKCFIEERFRKCREVYWKVWNTSRDIEQLTVRELATV